MTETGTSLADDGTPAYRYRLYSALRGSVWIVVVGVLIALDTFGVLSWGHSWPVLIIVAGLMVIFRQISYHAPAYPYPNPYAVPVATPPPSPAPGTSIVPSTQHDEEGR
jgi:hypothetical protein